MAGKATKQVLVPTDFSDSSLIALDHGILLAKLLKADIELLHVMEDFNATAELRDRFESSVDLAEIEENVVTHRRRHLVDFARQLKHDNLVKVTPEMETGRTYVQIVKRAETLNAAVIVMGAHGTTGFRERTAGSNAYRVVKEAQCPVLCVQQHTQKPGFKNILVPFTDQPHSREKVENAMEVAKLYNARLCVIGVDTEDSDEHRQKIQREADQIKAIAGRRSLPCDIQVVSEAYDADYVLKHAAEVNADLLMIMSSMDKLSIADYFKEGFVHGIVNRSPIPVLTIPPTFNPDTIDLRFY